MADLQGLRDIPLVPRGHGGGFVRSESELHSFFVSVPIIEDLHSVKICSVQLSACPDMALCVFSSIWDAEWDRKCSC